MTWIDEEPDTAASATQLFERVRAGELGKRQAARELKMPVTTFYSKYDTWDRERAVDSAIESTESEYRDRVQELIEETIELRAQVKILTDLIKGVLNVR